MNKSEKGFTLIEILAAITILGILSAIAIVSVNKIIQQGKEKHYVTAEKNLMLAGQSYVQDNRSELPKVVGQKKKVSLETLQTKNYIKEVVDYSENACDPKTSYVQVYKYSKDDYSYIAYLDCPSYTTSIDERTSTPQITITVSGVEKNAKAKITISDESKLMSYSYIVYKGTKEVLNSGNIMIENYAKSINKEVDLAKFTPGTLKVVVTATNIYGISKTETITNEFKDVDPPVCEIKEEDQNPKQWISEGNRKITVGCKDGEGSGCTREEFTKTFKDSAMYDYITISDESGNTTKCKVSVFIDKEKPSIKIKAYKRTSDGKREGNAILTAEVNHTTPTATLDLTKINSTKWLNESNYPYGIYYEIDYSDDVQLDSYVIKENSKGLATSTIEAATNKLTSSTTTKKQLSMNFSTKDDGYRTYIVTANDVAGNSISLNVIAPLDREAPTVPTVGLYKWTNNSTKPTSTSGLTTYSNDTWSNLNVYTAASSSTDKLSGFKEYQYTTTGKTANDKNKTASTRTIEAEGVSYIQYRACDIAGNCSTNSTKNTIKLDKTNPVCTVTGGSSTWINATTSAQSRTITAKCTDATSGCATKDFSHTYSTNMNISNAGANGQGAGGGVTDNAGNTATCAANQVVKIDKNAPTCSVSGGSSTWTNGNRTITATCSDTGGSGCSKASFSKTYSSNIDTAKAGAVDNKNGGTVSDVAGNVTSCAANQTVKIDKTAPTCTVSGGSSTWINASSSTQSRTVSATCSDTGGSGCVTDDFSYKYSTNINTTKAGAKGNGAGGSVSDAAGNVTNCAANKTVKIDKTAPTCSTTGGSTSWKNSNVTITGVCSDSGGSTCDGNSSKKYSSNTNTTSANPGAVYDVAGNSASCPNTTVRIDKTAPVITNIYNPTYGDPTDESFSLTLYGSDSGGSGISHWSYKYYRGSWSNYSNSGYSPYTTTKFSTARNEDVYIRLCDNAGNCSSEDSTPIYIVNDMCDWTETYNCGSWYWTSCTKDCGGGTQYQYRSCSLRSAYDSSTKCPGTKEETRNKNTSCNTHSCLDDIYDYRYNGCDEYYITVCDDTNCEYSEKNGSYKTGTIKRRNLTMSQQGNCCSEDDPYGCPQMHACRNGNTWIYTKKDRSSSTSYGGTVSNDDDLYIIEKTGSFYYVYVPGGGKFGNKYYDTPDYGYIYTNCIEPVTVTCRPAQCPDKG